MALPSELDAVEDNERQTASQQKARRDRHLRVIRDLPVPARPVRTVPILIARVKRGRVEFYLLRPTDWKELPAVEDLVTHASRNAGKPGKAERLYQEQLKTFLKEVVVQLEQWYRAGVFKQLVITGEESNTVPLQQLLPEPLLQVTIRVEGDNPDETAGELVDRLEREMP